MDWTPLDTWIVIIGILCAVSCALLGNFLVLRRMSMMGDAISHAVLPGLALAYLLTHSRGSWVMFVGAAFFGILTALLTQGLHRYGRMEEGAAMGVVFTLLFAVGLVLMVRGADAVDIDANCVLYGAMELTPLDRVQVGVLEIPRAALILSTVLIINLSFILLFFKELTVTSFDPELASALGFRPGLMHFVLMTLVAITAVAAFESVGSILVIAMLIIPGATAFLLTGRLPVMIAVSVGVAICCAVFGHIAAITVPRWWGYSDTSTAGSMAVCAGFIFTGAVFFSPREGWVVRSWHRARLSQQIMTEDALGFLYRLAEWKREGGQAEASELAMGHVLHIGRRRRKKLRARLDAHGYLLKGEGPMRLSELGYETGRKVVRAHRLWETYLHQISALPMDHLHGAAEKLEHVTDTDMRQELESSSGGAAIDPQGREIPPES